MNCIYVKLFINSSKFKKKTKTNKHMRSTVISQLETDIIWTIVKSKVHGEIVTKILTL
jgi:hypothetical protein